MKAVVIHAYGGPEELKFQDYPDPPLGSDDVLIRVAASSVNPFDLKLRSGALKEKAPLVFPSVLGFDVSGIVEKTGADVTTFKVGDSVFAHASQSYAQFCAVKASDLAKVPIGMDTVDIAALPTVTMTGQQLAELALGGRSLSTILITGAMGNVGRSAVYEAKRRGATVIAGVLKRQIEEALSTGADSVVALDDDAALATVAALDAVADTVSGPVSDTLIAKVKSGGVFASTVSIPSNASKFPEVRSKYMQVKPDVAGLLRLAEAVKNGKLTIPLGQKFALKDASQAHAAAEKHGIGKILLVV